MTITKTQAPINMSILGELKLYDIFTGHNEIENKISDFDNTQKKNREKTRETNKIKYHEERIQNI